MEFLDRINDFDAIFITPVNRYSADLWLLSLIPLSERHLVLIDF